MPHSHYGRKQYSLLLDLMKSCMCQSDESRTIIVVVSYSAGMALKWPLSIPHSTPG